jgi:hypothetical protein
MYTDKHHFYVTLYSSASQILHPENTVGAFTNELAQPTGLDPSDRWEVRHCEFSCPQHSVGAHKIGESVKAIIYCDLIPAQLVGSSLARCLRTFTYPATRFQLVFKNVYYLPV